MKHYELLLVLKPTLTEEEAKNTVAQMSETLAKNNAVLTSTIEMGVRKLAYQIKKYERGNYIIFYFTAPAACISEIERIIRINEDIIKFLTVKFETKTEIAHWESQSKGIKSEPKKESKAQIQEATEEKAQEETKAE